ncbi:acyltransferase family protein [Paenibacillus hamazuiensis]|uniref:acyltransferase family protein n=1 Tax=Paenibacillus hamazuiensis TaxID=2936508 RepID=UPI003B845E7C
MRIIHIDILKGLGIIFVVMGHIFDPFSWFPVYSFHMALFLFASGYLYKPNHESNIITFFKRRVINLLIPYFSYNVFFAIVTYWLHYYHGINLFQESPDINIKNLLVP